MHKTLLNQACLRIVLKPRGPWLIKSGVEAPDPTRPGMEFVRTRHARVGDTVYLPGTSLKGALRSHAERVLQGIGVQVCDPLDRRLACKSPGGRHETPVVYKEQCPACRTFGSLAVAGRCSIFDAYPWPNGADDETMSAAARVANATERRNQVAIDRATGEARPGALFDLEVVVAGEFHTEIRLQNFQLWQLGLIATVLQDMNDGYVPIGFGKSRGLGQVALSWPSFEMQSFFAGPAGPGVRRDDHHLLGVGALASPESRRDYGLFEKDSVELPEGVRAEPTWRGCRVSVSGPELERLLAATIDRPLADFTASRATSPRKTG